MVDTYLSSFIWSVADLLRGDYEQSEYGKVILNSYTMTRSNSAFVSSAAMGADLRDVTLRTGVSLNGIVARLEARIGRTLEARTLRDLEQQAGISVLD